MLAQIGEDRARRQAVDQKRPRRGGDQGLVTVAGPEDTGAAVEGRREPVSASGFGNASLDGHAYREAIHGDHSVARRAAAAEGIVARMPSPVCLKIVPTHSPPIAGSNPRCR